MSIDQSANDFLFSSGPKAAKFEEIGDTVKGRIVSAAMRQQTDPDGYLKTWSNGDPVMQLVITLQPDGTTDDEDRLAIYAKGGAFEAAKGDGTSMLVAIREAVKKVGATGLDVGGTLAVKHSGLGKKTNPAYSAPKLYQASYKAPAVTIEEDPF